MRRLKTVGLSSRAAVYAILALLAGDIALHGSSPSKADSQGALSEVAKQPAGPVLLGILAGGLISYALWRLAQALRRSRAGPSKTSPWTRIGWAAASIVYFGLSAQAIGLIVGSGSKGGPSSHPTPLVAAMLKLPAGQGLVGVAGFAVAFAGIGLAIWGCLRDYDKTLEVGRMSRRSRQATRLTGIAGEVTRGLLVVLVSVYLISAAVTDQPHRVKDLGSSIQALVHDPFGTALLALAAFGLLMFAIYSCFEAAYRRC